MKKNCTLLVFAALLLGSVATAHAQSEFAANLDGDQEVATPPVMTSAFGQATFDVNVSESTLGMNFTLSATNLKDAFTAHIHCAPRNANGPIIMFLAGGADPGAAAPYDLNGPWIGSAKVADANVIPRMCTNSTGGMSPVNNLIDVITLMVQGLAYVNIHTIAHPAGEIRGQIEVVAKFSVP